MCCITETLVRRHRSGKWSEHGRRARVIYNEPRNSGNQRTKDRFLNLTGTSATFYMVPATELGPTHFLTYHKTSGCSPHHKYHARTNAVSPSVPRSPSVPSSSNPPLPSHTANQSSSDEDKSISPTRPCLALAGIRDKAVVSGVTFVSPSSSEKRLFPSRTRWSSSMASFSALSFACWMSSFSIGRK